MEVKMPHNEETIHRATGKTWEEWKSVIDAWGGADKTHMEIARFLIDQHGVEDWWAQGVTVGYERAIGRRKVGQSIDGTFSASLSRAINVKAELVHEALVNETGRSQWLDDGLVTFRTASAPKSARFDDLQADTIIAFFLTDRGEKTSLQIQGEKFSSKEAADEWKAAWKPRLDKLIEYLSAD